MWGWDTHPTWNLMHEMHKYYNDEFGKPSSSPPSVPWHNVGLSRRIQGDWSVSSVLGSCARKCSPSFDILMLSPRYNFCMSCNVRVNARCCQSDYRVTPALMLTRLPRKCGLGLMWWTASEHEESDKKREKRTLDAHEFPIISKYYSIFKLNYRLETRRLSWLRFNDLVYEGITRYVVKVPRILAP